MKIHFQALKIPPGRPANARMSVPKPTKHHKKIESMKIEQLKNTLLPATLLLAATGGLASCSDDWSEHYEQGTVSGSQPLSALLEGHAELSAFAGMVRQAGYGDLLSSPQTLTVFAPVNDALADIDTDDALAVRQTVENHIGRFSYPLSAASAQTKVRMLNGKRLDFAPASGGYALDGAPLAPGSELASNGLLHTLTRHAVYRPNFYEYVTAAGNCSRLRAFLDSYQKRLFDPEQSVEIDVDASGRPVYDSVFVNYNVLLQDERLGLADIQNEDSVYTMLIPDDNAWQAAYDRLHPAFKVTSGDYTPAEMDSIQDVQTQQAIVANLFVRGKVDPLAADSVVTTTGSVMKNLTELFANAVPVEMSNGTGYVVSALNYDNLATWSKPVGVEAEESDNYSFTLSTTSVYPRIVAADNAVQGISGNSYLEVTPVRTTAAPAVEFKLPEVLGGEDDGVAYNIYVVMVPGLVDGEESASDSTQMQFTLYYTAGGSRKQLARSATLETSGRELVRLEAFSGFRFPESDHYDRLREIGSNYAEPVYAKFSLSATTTSKSSDKTHTRNFRIDRIILEPVKIDN